MSKTLFVSLLLAINLLATPSSTDKHHAEKATVIVDAEGCHGQRYLADYSQDSLIFKTETTESHKIGDDIYYYFCDRSPRFDETVVNTFYLKTTTHIIELKQSKVRFLIYQEDEAAYVIAPNMEKVARMLTSVFKESKHSDCVGVFSNSSPSRLRRSLAVINERFTPNPKTWELIRVILNSSNRIATDRDSYTALINNLPYCTKKLKAAHHHPDL